MKTNSETTRNITKYYINRMIKNSDCLTLFRGSKSAYILNWTFVKHIPKTKIIEQGIAIVYKNFKIGYRFW